MGCASSSVPASANEVGSLGLPSDIGTSQDFHNKYELSSKVGRGCYAQVNSAFKRDKKTTGEIVVKITQLTEQNSPHKLNAKVCSSTYNEACLWIRIGRHPNCVNMFECYFDEHLCYFVMEKCQQTLVDYVATFSAISEESFPDIFAQILQGIKHIHSFRICHRDVKPANILVAGKKSPILKLADFGLAAYVPEGAKIKNVVGTPAYMCPEMLKSREHDLKADMWSFGVVAYLFLCGEFPYRANSSRDFTSAAMKTAILQGGPPKCKKSWLSNDTISFLTSALERDPNTRASPDFALSMPYLKKRRKTECTTLPSLVAWGFKDWCEEGGELHKTTSIDKLLDKMKDGKLQSTCRALRQDHVQDYIHEDPQIMEQRVANFFSIDCSDATQQEEECSASKATTWLSSHSRPANMSSSTISS